MPIKYQKRLAAISAWVKYFLNLVPTQHYHILRFYRTNITWENMPLWTTPNKGSRLEIVTNRTLSCCNRKTLLCVAERVSSSRFDGSLGHSRAIRFQCHQWNRRCLRPWGLQLWSTICSGTWIHRWWPIWEPQGWYHQLEHPAYHRDNDRLRHWPTDVHYWDTRQLHLLYGVLETGSERPHAPGPLQPGVGRLLLCRLLFLARHLLPVATNVFGIQAVLCRLDNMANTRVHSR